MTAPANADLEGLPKGRPDCPHCTGHGYRVRGVGELAVAEACVCLPVCARCHGTGRVVTEHQGRTVAGRCRCQRLVDNIERFNRVKIPARHASSTIASFMTGASARDMSKMGAAVGVNNWLNAFRPGRENPGLILWGMVGRGKTHLLCGVLRHLVFEHDVDARFIEFTRLLGELKEGYSQRRSDTPVLRQLAEVPVLGIDELGKGRLTDWEVSVIDDVVSRRYNAMGCTLGTTNFRPGAASGTGPMNLATDGGDVGPTQTLGDRVGDRVYSRLQQMAEFTEVAGQDFRKFRR